MAPQNPPAHPRLWFALDLTAVAGLNHNNDKAAVVNAVLYLVASGSHSPFDATSELLCPGRPGRFSQKVNGRLDPATGLGRELV